MLGIHINPFFKYQFGFMDMLSKKSAGGFTLQ